MFNQQTAFPFSNSTHTLTRLLLPKDNLGALSHDATILASACPGKNTVQYTHLPTQSTKTIGAANVTALCFRPNDKQYQQFEPAREIKSNELIIACCGDNQIRRCIPSLGAWLQAVPVQQPTALSCSPTGQLLAVGTAGGQLLVFDLAAQDLNLVFSSTICQEPIERVLFGADGEHLFAIGQNRKVYLARLQMEYFEEAGSYLQPGGSVYPKSRITRRVGQAREVHAIAYELPEKISHMSAHPTIRQVALTTLQNRIYFWNYACSCGGYFDCPLNGPLTGFFCPDSDHFVVDSREGLAVYQLTRLQKRVANSTAAGGPFSVQYEIVLSTDSRPKIFAHNQPGGLICTLVEKDGVCLAACS